MSQMTVQEAQERLGEVLRQSSSSGEVIYLTDQGVRLGAIMSAHRAAVLDGLLAVDEFKAEHGPFPPELEAQARDILDSAGVTAP
jgi:hypothetical protein